jgi:hypothetical protein
MKHVLVTMVPRCLDLRDKPTHLWGSITIYKSETFHSSNYTRRLQEWNGGMRPVYSCTHRADVTPTKPRPYHRVQSLIVARGNLLESEEGIKGIQCPN